MGGREAQRRPPPARKRRSDGLPPADGRAPRPPCEAGLEEAMVAVGSTCAAAWPRRKAATLAVMTFNGPKGERVKLQLGLPRGIRNPSPSLLFSSLLRRGRGRGDGGVWVRFSVGRRAEPEGEWVALKTTMVGEADPFVWWWVFRFLPVFGLWPGNA